MNDAPSNSPFGENVDLEIILPAKSMDDLADGLVALTAAIDAVDSELVVHGVLGGEHGYGAHWDSAIFTMRPYYWGDCDCGADRRSEKWWAASPHAADCYQTELHKRIAEYDEASGYAALEAATSAPGMMVSEVQETDFGVMTFSGRSEAGEAAHQAWCKAYDARRKAEDRIMRELCREHKIPWNKAWGAMVHCTCGVQERATAYFATEGHYPTCALELPNFRHHASGLEVRWYKWIGRDTETIGKAPDLAAMFAECMNDVALHRQDGSA